MGIGCGAHARRVRLGYDLLEGRALPSGVAHLDLAERQVAEITPDVNDYSSPAVVTWAGIDGADRTTNTSQCASFETALLRTAYGFTADQFAAWTGSTSPTAARYYDATAANDGFSAVPLISEVLPGDFLAIKYLDATTSTGHVATVAAAPSLVTTTAAGMVFDVVVIDSSSGLHGNDTRGVTDPTTGTHDTGVGRGTMRVYTDAAGALTGYSWSTLSSSVVYGPDLRPAVFGRVPPSSLAAPTGLAAAAVSRTAIALSWNDNSVNEGGVRVERSADGGATWQYLATVGTDAVSYRDTTCAPGTTYTYRVSAVGGLGSSAYSDPAAATTPAGTPTAPSQLKATTSRKGKTTLTWTDTADNESGFIIEYSVNGGAWVQLAAAGANTTSWSTGGLGTGNTYAFRVVAYNAYGYSAPSNTVVI